MKILFHNWFNFSELIDFLADHEIKAVLELNSDKKKITQKS